VAVCPTARRAKLALLAAAALAAIFLAIPARAAQIEACFSPPLPGGCDPAAAIIQAIGTAHNTIFVQMYAFTSRQIVTALLRAKRRGVAVRAIVDRSQLAEDHSDTNAVGRLAAGGVPVLVDSVRGLMHNKIMIVDGTTVCTGSFNYTWSAEHKNAENLLVIHDSALAAEYMQNWKLRAARSQPLLASQTGAPPATPAHPDATDGSVVGNRRSMIYEWPGCPYYGNISPRNAVTFPSAQAAQTAGYRSAKNCQ
jgi:phosphatidylserine/phosphatidylglycerophosphate/cardiolipin synthase-like enzyme